MTILAEERLIFIFVLISFFALIYAIEKIAKRKVYNRLIILLLLAMLSWFYMDKVEVYYRNKIIKGEESLIQEADYPEEPGPILRNILGFIEKLNPNTNRE